jgi:hypothetical protein
MRGRNDWPLMVLVGIILSGCLVAAYFLIFGMVKSIF